MLRPRLVLALGAHTDDIELGCGATLSRMRRQGVRIIAVALSRAELSRPPGSPEDLLEQEYRSAMGVLGVSAEDVLCLGYPVRSFSEHRQSILDALIDLRNEFDPDLVLTSAGSDTHQDHSVLHAESVRAYRNRAVLGYHSPWNERAMITNYFVEVSDEDLSKKIAMLGCYQSQHELARPYVTRSALETSLRFYGQQCGLEYAEAFEVLSFVVKGA